MRIVLAAHSLLGLGGSETYAVTVADHLQRLGHDVWLHSAEHGRSSDAARRLGVRVCGADDLPPAPDVLVVQDGVVACELAARYPLVPQAFVAHSDIFDLQLPPQLPGLVAVVVALYDRVQRRIEALALRVPIVRLTQPIDVERFKPGRASRPAARVGVTVGNYLNGPRLALLARSCERAGVDLRHVGAHAPGGVLEAEALYDEADIVFGKARVILEAMASGRAAYVFDHNGADGWVTAESYARLAPDNFGGQGGGDPLDADRLALDLAGYDASMGLVNRDLAVSHHAASAHAAALVGVLDGLAPRREPIDAPLLELARLTRLRHRAETQVFGSSATHARLGAQIQALEHELELRRDEHRERVAALARERDETAAELARARLELAWVGARREALTAETQRLGSMITALVGSRRWRATQTLLAPADRIRGRRARRPRTPVASPAPFVVGVPRSGTTLLRLLLDSHSQLAIGGETGFGIVAGLDEGPTGLLAALMTLAPWPEFGLDPARTLELLHRVQPWSVGGGLRALYREFAAREGKPRWGDKTPMHVTCMPTLHAALPEARFIHIIRDGRDVAASLRRLPFAPGDGSIETIADVWRGQIEDARAQAVALPHYREVRYEQLVHEPEQVLRELSAFVELDFEPAMLRSHERAQQRLGDVFDAERLTRHSRTMTPPDPTRAGRWREALSDAEVARFDAVAGDLLTELGYR
jgi:sulfotransferase family protein